MFLCNISFYSIGFYSHHQSYPQLGVFLLWLHLFNLSEVISPLFSSSILGTYWPGSSSFSVISFCLFILFMGFSRQEYRSCLPFLLQWTMFCQNSPPWPVCVGCVQFSSVTQLCLTHCNSMDCSMPGFSVHHQLLKPTQTHVHRVDDVIQPSHPLLSPSSPAFNLSQNQGLFKWVNSSHQVAKVLEFLLQC